MNDAQRKYKQYIKRKYVEFDMRRADERAMYNRANQVTFSKWVKSLLRVDRA